MPKATEQDKKVHSRFGGALTLQREAVGFAKQSDAADASTTLAREAADVFESFSQQWLSRLESDQTGERIDAANRRKLRTLSYLLGWSGSEFEYHVGVPVGTVPRLVDEGIAQLSAVIKSVDNLDISPSLVRIPVFNSLIDGVREFDSGTEPERYQSLVQSELPRGVNVSKLYFGIVAETDLYDESLNDVIPVGARLLVEARKVPKVGQLIVSHLPVQNLSAITRFRKNAEDVLFRTYQRGGVVVWSSEAKGMQNSGVVKQVCFEP